MQSTTDEDDNFSSNLKASKIKTSKIKTGLKYTSISLFVVFLLFAGILLIYPNTNNARFLIQSQINKIIPGSISIKDINLSLFSGNIELKEILLMDSFNQKIVRINRIFIAISWKSFLKKELCITESKIVKPWINLKINKDGKLNLISALTSSSEQSDKSDTGKSDSLLSNIILKNFKLIAGEVNCFISDKKVNIKIPDINFNISDFNFNDLTGSFNIKTAKGSFQAKLQSPNNLSDVNKTTGSFTLVANLSRKANNLLKGMLNFQGEKLVIGDIIVGDIKINTFLDKTGKLSISNLSLKNKQSTIKGNGDIQILQKDSLIFAPKLLSNFKLMINNVQLENFLTTKVSNGIINGKLKINGDLYNPQINLVLNGKDIAIENYSIGNIDIDANCIKLYSPKNILNPQCKFKIQGEKINLDIQEIQNVKIITRLNNKDFFIDDLLVTIAKEEIIKGKGSFSIDDFAYKLDISSTPISFNSINEIKKLKTVYGKITLTDIQGKGTITSPTINGAIKLTDLVVSEKPMENVTLGINISDELVKIWGNPGFDLQAKYQIDKKNFTVLTKFNNTDLTPYFKIAGKIRDGDSKFDGNITGTIKINGNIEQLDNINADAMFSDINIFFDKNDFLKTNNANIKFNKKKFTVVKTNFTLFKEGYIDIYGDGKIDKDINITINGKLPLKVTSLFTDQIQKPTGTIDFTASIDGPFAKPDIKATVAMNKLGGILPSLYNEKFHNIKGEIKITPEIIKVNDIHGNFADGNFNVKGKINLEQFKPVKMKINLNAKQIGINVSDTMNILFDSDISLVGTKEQSKISGKVVILDGLYYKDLKVNILDLAQKKREISPVNFNDKSKSFMKNVELNINVSNRESFTVDNNLASLSLKPNLKIYGTLQNPLLTGQVKSKHGFIIFRNKKFELKTGVIDFINPYKIEPEIIFKSQVKIRKWTIILNISGTINNLDFKFDSTPWESDADILSLITFGKTTYERSVADKTSTKQIVADVVADEVSDSIKKATGLDTVDLKVTDGNNTEPDDITVTLGKNLSRRISVNLGVELTDGKTIQKVTTQYKILEPLKINVYQNTEGEFGGELQYKHEFR